jgi:hypothetical protein
MGNQRLEHPLARIFSRADVEQILHKIQPAGNSLTWINFFTPRSGGYPDYLSRIQGRSRLRSAHG